MSTSNNQNNPQFRCPECRQVFTSLNIMNDHIYAFHELNNDMEIDNGSDNDEEQNDDENNEDEEENDSETAMTSAKYSCDICKMKFIQERTLTRHFNEKHNNYQDQLKLVSNKTFGFPGFEALIALHMITDIDKCTYDAIKPKFDKDTLSCQVCEASFYENTELQKSTIKSDSDIVLSKTKDTYSFHPYKTMCCNKFICDVCVYGRVMYTGLACPYCMKNYEKNNVHKYVCVYEPNTLPIDKTRWKSWREKHKIV